VLGIGLVVDDAIIVVENVNRHLDEGMKPVQAAILAARELATPSSRWRSCSSRCTSRSDSSAG